MLHGELRLNMNIEKTWIIYGIYKEGQNKEL